MNEDKKRFYIDFGLGILVLIFATLFVVTGIRGCSDSIGSDGGVPVSSEIERVGEDLRAIAAEQQLLTAELRSIADGLGADVDRIGDVADTLDRNRGVIDSTADLAYDSYILAGENDEAIRRGYDIVGELRREGESLGETE